MKIAKLLFVFAFLLFFSVESYAQGRFSVVVDQQGTASVTSSSDKVIDAEAKRNYLLVQNNGTASVYLKFNSAHTGDEGVLIDAGGYYEPNYPGRGAVYMKSTSGSQLINYITGKGN